MNRENPTHTDVWFVYDGDCPICTTAAHALRIREAAGSLHLINAREEAEHPLVRCVRMEGLDLDKGMVLGVGEQIYHGDTALHMMAMLGSPSGWFNRMNIALFRSRIMSRVCYPAMLATRNLMLWLKGVEKLNLPDIQVDRAPIFSAVFGPDWDRLPPVMKKHYAVRPGIGDMVRVEGALDVDVGVVVSLLARLGGTLVSRSGRKVPVSVTFNSDAEGAFHFDRRFRYPDGREESFRSRMVVLGNAEVLEIMRFGLGWRAAYSWDGTKVTLRHRGYVWRVGGMKLPVPLALLIGRGHAEETPLSDDRFAMWTETRHPLFGRMFGYEGEFRIAEVRCGPS